jgi:hypothetical protein
LKTLDRANIMNLKKPPTPETTPVPEPSPNDFEKLFEETPEKSGGKALRFLLVGFAVAVSMLFAGLLFPATRSFFIGFAWCAVTVFGLLVNASAWHLREKLSGPFHKCLDGLSSTIRNLHSMALDLRTQSDNFRGYLGRLGSSTGQISSHLSELEHGASELTGLAIRSVGIFHNADNALVSAANTLWGASNGIMFTFFPGERQSIRNVGNELHASAEKIRPIPGQFSEIARNTEETIGKIVATAALTLEETVGQIEGFRNGQLEQLSAVIDSLALQLVAFHKLVRSSRGLVDALALPLFAIGSAIALSGLIGLLF